MVNNFKKYIKNIIPWHDESFKVLRLHEKAHRSILHGHRYMADYFSYRISKKYRCYIHPAAKIGENVFFPHPVGIVIGAGVEIGNDVTIYQGVTIGRKYMQRAEYPVIGDNVVIYANVVIAGRIEIKDNATIGCNSVVLRNVAKSEVVSGIVK